LYAGPTRARDDHYRDLTLREILLIFEIPVSCNQNFKIGGLGFHDFMLRPATGSLNIGLDGKISGSKINFWTAGLLRE